MEQSEHPKDFARLLSNVKIWPPRNSPSDEHSKGETIGRKEVAERQRVCVHTATLCAIEIYCRYIEFPFSFYADVDTRVVVTNDCKGVGTGVEES